MAGDNARYALLEVTVQAHARYGLVVRSAAGEDGFVDSDYIADQPVPPEDWPAVGTHLWGVVLGHTRDGRLRLCTAPKYVAVARSADMAAVMGRWRDLREAEDRYLGVAREFRERPDAEPVLRWALTGPYHPADRATAVRLLAAAPVALRAGLAPELLAAALANDHPDELLEILATIDDQRLSQALPDAVESVALTADGARRLGRLFRRIGANDALDRLRSMVAASQDPDVRAIDSELRA